jgi:hypothetical protein
MLSAPWAHDVLSQISVGPVESDMVKQRLALVRGSAIHFFAVNAKAATTETVLGLQKLQRNLHLLPRQQVQIPKAGKNMTPLLTYRMD